MHQMISERDKLRSEMNWSVTKSFLSLFFLQLSFKYFFLVASPIFILGFGFGFVTDNVNALKPSRSLLLVSHF